MKILKKRADPREGAKALRPRWDSNSIVGIILLVLSGFSLGAMILTSSARQLTGLESTLLSVITFVLSTAGSFIVSAHFSQRQARKEYEQLARPSLRRVDSLLKAAAHVEQMASKRAEEIRASPESDPGMQLVWLQGLQSNLQLLLHQIQDATSDWRELLPEDYADALRQAADQAAAYQAVIEGLEDNIREQSELMLAGNDEAKSRVQELERRLQREKTKAAVSVLDGIKPITIDTSSIVSRFGQLSSWASAPATENPDSILLNPSPSQDRKPE